MKQRAWKDPIIEEVRQVRKKLDKELEKDPKGFMEKAHKLATKLGMKVANLTPARLTLGKPIKKRAK